MMLVVLAYTHDVGARSLVQRWRADGEEAALLTCADMSRAGWRYVAGNPAAGRAVIEGQVIATREIRALVTRIPAVGEAELGHVHEEDRRYAAAEMQAFLLAWLTSLECPVLNRPSPSNLGGPEWSVVHWVRRARRVGLAARPVTQRSVYVPDTPSEISPRADGSSIFVDVVGDRAILVCGSKPDPDEAPFAQGAIALARDAGTEMLRVYFERGLDGRPVFLEAGLWVDVASEEVANALTARCRDIAHAGADTPVEMPMAAAWL
jgi:hypothetical protein